MRFRFMVTSRLPFFGVRSMRVISLNLNGIRSAEKKGLSLWLEKKAGPWDVLCVQELKAGHDDVPETMRAPGKTVEPFVPGGHGSRTLHLSGHGIPSALPALVLLALAALRRRLLSERSMVADRWSGAA